MKPDVMHVFPEVLFYANNLFVIIGLTLVIITFLICGTIILTSHMKEQSRERQHKSNLEEAEKIREKCCCNHCEVKVRIKTDTAKTKGEKRK